MAIFFDLWKCRAATAPKWERINRGKLKYPPVYSIMCKWTRPFWGTDCRRAPKSLSSAQAASLCSAGIERARKCCILKPPALQSKGKRIMTDRPCLPPPPTPPPLFGDPPFSIKHPQENFSLQNVNWHPPKRDWLPPICSFCIELHRNLPSPVCTLEGANCILEAEIVLGVLHRKGVSPKKTQKRLFPSPKTDAHQLSAPNRAIWCDCDLRFESRKSRITSDLKGSALACDSAVT